MNSQPALGSTHVSLAFDDWPGSHPGTSLHALWQAFRRTAVEPGQAAVPDLVSFADECLLCAQITLNRPRAGDDDAAALGVVDTADAPAFSRFPARPSSPPYVDPHIGLVYLHAGPANVPAGEANVGIILTEGARRRGYAREAVRLVLAWAFERLGFHRVQAAILDSPFKDRALRLFIGSGFMHEGTKRRAVYQPEGEGMASVWKDVTYVAMLDTDWMLQSTWKLDNLRARPPVSAWDEMFARHAREREELLKWEEKNGRMTRSSSTETLRNAAPDLAYLTDDAASVSVPSRDVSSSPAPRPGIMIWDDDSEMEGMFGMDDEPGSLRSLVSRRDREHTGRASFPRHLQPSPLADRILSLPSIPSTRFSEGNPQSPLTIRTASSPGTSPPSSPSDHTSSIRTSWESDPADDWYYRSTAPFQRATHDPFSDAAAGPSLRSRSSSSSSADSADTWSDAQSSAGAGSSTWDMLSDTSDQSPRAHARV